jgi:hypothetical protein
LSYHECALFHQAGQAKNREPLDYFHRPKVVYASQVAIRIPEFHIPHFSVSDFSFSAFAYGQTTINSGQLPLRW